MGYLQFFLWAPAIITVVALGVKIYFKAITGICKSKRRIDGQVAIVTGANSGIGYEAAKELARRGAKVILACRSMDKAKKACDEINRATNGTRAVPKELDVSDMDSVRRFAAEILKEETRLDILVNNAGVAGLRKNILDNGLEYQIAANHFGPFLLTNLLMGLMIKTGKARIIAVSSVAHTWTKTLDLDNLNAEKFWEPKLLYARTKLCNILFTKELARRLKAAGHTGIVANAVNPGGVRTAIFRHARKAFKYMVMVSQIYFKTPWEGAQPTIDLAVSEEVEGISGQYWENCKISRPSELAENEQLAKDLWEKSASLVQLKPEEYFL
jgi:NAD(P)-dependent dehydrogenase (short-subunit alcohol dehydrogenase family)